MTLATHRRATALADRAWERCWRRVRRGQAPLPADRARWERLLAIGRAALDREQAETAAKLEEVRRCRTSS